MPTVEERLAFLEGQVMDHSRRLDEIRQAIVSLEARMDQRFAALEVRFAAFDNRFTGLDHRIDLLDAKCSRQFTWLVGLQVTTLAAIVAALLTR